MSRAAGGPVPAGDAEALREAFAAIRDALDVAAESDPDGLALIGRVAFVRGALGRVPAERDITGDDLRRISERCRAAASEYPAHTPGLPRSQP